MNVSEIRKMSGEQGEVLSVVFLPDGVHALSAGANGTIILWEAESGLEIRRFQHCQSFATCVAPSPNGLLMLSGGWDGYIRLWDISTGREIMNIRAYSSDQGVSSVAFSADGRFALSGYDHPMRLRPSTGMTAFTVVVESMPMGPRMDETVRLWDLQSGREVRKWNVATFFVSSVAFSPDGRYAACGTYSNTRIWETSTWNEIRKWTGALKGSSSIGVRSLSFSQDGQLILTGKGWPDNSVCLFEVNGGHQVNQFKGHTARVNGVALSADGRYALSGCDDGAVILWNTDSGTENCRFTGHSERVNSVALSKNSPYAISGSDDGTLRLWPLPASTAATSQLFPAAPPPYEVNPPLSSPTYPCSNCGTPLEYRPEYQKWYCKNCKEYT